MADIAQLGIEIDTRKLKSGEKDLASFSSAAQKVDDTVKTATKTMLAFVGAASVGEIIKIADKMTQLNARVALYTKNATEATAVMSQLNSIANASGSSIGSVSDLYSRMAASLQEMGASQGQILRLTDTINKLGVAGGSSPEAMSNAMMQLSQAMTNGTMRAEEYRSILENTPLIVQKAAESMGISVGDLTNKMLAGSLSSRDFANAILGASNSADQMASKMPRTVGQATQALSNNFSQLVNAVNNATSSTSVISAAIDDVAASFLDLTNAFKSDQIGKYAESFALQWKSAGSDVTNVMRYIVDIFDAGLKAVDADGRHSAQFLSDAFWQFPANVKAAIQVIVVELASLVDKAAVYGEQIAFYLDPRNWGDGAQIDSYVEQKIAGINKARDATIDGFMAERTASITASNEMKKQADEVRAAFEKRAEANKIAMSSAPITGGKTTSAATATGKGTDAAASKLATMQKNAAEYLTEVSRFNATEAQQIQNWQEDQLKQLELFHKAGAVSEQNFAWAKQEIIAEANRRLQKLNDDQWSEYLNGSSAALLKLKQQAQTQLTGPKQQIVVSGIDKKLQEQAFANLPTIDAGSQTNEQNQIAQLQTQTTAMNDAYNQRIEQYKAYRALEVENAAYYDGQIAALEKKKEENNKAAQDAMLNLQISQGAAIAASAADGFKALMGEQSTAYKTMFAVQKAFAIAQSMIAIQAAMASASWSLPFPGNLGAMATVAAATANIVSSIMSVASPSFDGGGYTGNGSRTGGLDGKGGFWAMMHPQETVIDHTKSSGKGVSFGGSGNVTVNVSLQETSDTSKQGTTEQSTSDDGSVQISVFVSDIRSEGAMAQVLERTYGLTRMGA